MRTSERTLDTLRNYRVPSPSEMQEIYLDLRDLAAMERERDELIDALRRCNCQPCDIPACNCGSWHRRPSKADIEIDELRGGL